MSCLQATELICFATDSSDPDTAFPPPPILPRLKVTTLVHWLTAPFRWQVEERGFCRSYFLLRPTWAGCESSGWVFASARCCDSFIRTLCTSRAICFQASSNDIRGKYPQGIIFKGDFKQLPKGKKKYGTFELQGIAGEIFLSKTVQRSSLFSLRGKLSVGPNQGYI